MLLEAWRLAELVLLFLTQAAMEMESRVMLALLLLSLCLGMFQRRARRFFCFQLNFNCLVLSMFELEIMYNIIQHTVHACIAT